MPQSDTGQGKSNESSIVDSVYELYNKVTNDYNEFTSEVYSMSKMKDVDNILDKASKLSDELNELDSKLPQLKDAVCNMYKKIVGLIDEAKKLRGKLNSLTSKLSSLNVSCGGRSFNQKPEQCLEDAKNLLNEAEQVHNEALKLQDEYNSIDVSVVENGSSLYETVKEWVRVAEKAVDEVKRILSSSTLYVYVRYKDGRVEVDTKLSTPLEPVSDIGRTAKSNLANVLWSYVLSESHGLKTLVENGLPGIDTSSLDAYIESLMDAKKRLDEIREVVTGKNIEWGGRTVAIITSDAAFTRLYNKLANDVERRVREIEMNDANKQIRLYCRGWYDIRVDNGVLEPSYNLGCLWTSTPDVESSVEEELSKELQGLAEEVNSLVDELNALALEYNDMISNVMSVTGSRVTIDSFAAALTTGYVDAQKVEELQKKVEWLLYKLGDKPVTVISTLSSSSTNTVQKVEETKLVKLSVGSVQREKQTGYTIVTLR